MKHYAHLSDLQALVGQEIGHSDWLVVDQERIDLFARATGDLAEDGTADEDTADLSDDGTDADPNDNGDPGEPGEDDPTPLPPFPVTVLPWKRHSEPSYTSEMYTPESRLSLMSLLVSEMPAFAMAGRRSGVASATARQLRSCSRMTAFSSTTACLRSAALQRRMWLIVAVAIVVWVLLTWLLPLLMGSGPTP